MHEALRKRRRQQVDMLMARSQCIVCRRLLVKYLTDDRNDILQDVLVPSLPQFSFPKFQIEQDREAMVKAYNK